MFDKTISKENGLTNHAMGSDRYPTPKYYFPRRYLLVMIGFLGLCMAYILRVLISTTVLDMQTEFNYSNSFKGLLLASFFMGYLSTQLLAQPLCDKIGGKKTLFIGLSLSIISSLFVPLAAPSKVAVVFVRIVTGITQGITYPTMNWLMSRWYPISERSSLASKTWTGAYVGTILVDFISPLILEYLGWEKAFYIFAGTALSWSILWAIFIKDNPKDVIIGIHPNELAFINETEESQPSEKSPLINNGVGGQYGTINQEVAQDNRANFSAPNGASFNQEEPLDNQIGGDNNIELPYFKVVKILLTSKALLTLLYFNLVTSWGFYLLLMWYPTWLVSVGVKTGIQLSFFNALPYIISVIIANVSGIVADKLMARGVKKIIVRKVLGVLTGLIPGVFLFLIAFCKLSNSTQIAFMVIIVCSNGFSAAGPQMVTLDISPKYAGVTMGIGNFVATIPGILGPLIAGVLLEKFNSSWTQIFSMSGAFYLSGAIIWLLFASSDKVL
ncbi:hypothetical protein RB653_005381 [Dictyostelium firmibasis]|uniref:Major facilitator superfamily (MFS) profile domain-containing protein n=1 Tax=Dictyostelium firmibasis TaxID=79012 RepID=A0AAN7U9D9_9MYCE